MCFLKLFQATLQPYLDPYFASIQLSSMCLIDEDIYLMRCPLICFYVVEYHLPHRVAQQFGLRQEFPVDPFSISTCYCNYYFKYSMRY
jgi:hypothetical protein